jgi:S1-C subfamily serine protease
MALEFAAENRMSDRLRRIVGFGAWLAVMAGVTSSSAETNPQKIYRKALPSVMTLEVENQVGERFVGSAVMALADDVAVTAWHVVCDARSVWATFADGTKVQATGCIDKDGERDLALLKLEKGLPGRRATMNSDLQSVATKAYVIGTPKGYGFSISDGLVSQIRHVDGFPQYQVSCPISPGNSGGPVLDDRGRVIGIVSWTKSDAQNVSFAIPSREVARLNVGSKAMAWGQLSSSARPPLAQRWVDAERPVSTESKSVATRGFEEFTKRLEKSAGKKITVSVQEDGQENKFTFTVPRRALK